MRRHFLSTAIIALSLSIMYSGCKKAFEDDNYAYQGEKPGSDDSSTSSSQATQNGASLDEIVSQTTKDSPEDYNFDLSTANKITGKGSSVEVTGTGAQANGSVATITKSGCYIVEGSINDGQVTIDLPESDEGTVKLILNSCSIKSSTSAALMVNKCKKVSVLLKDGSDNKMESSAPAVEGDSDETQYAAIHSKQDIFFSAGDAATGKLTVSSANNHGIKCTDGIIFKTGNYTVTASNNDGIQAKTYITTEKSNITVEAYQHGIKTTSDNKDRGYIYINGGNYNIKSTSPASDDGGCDAIHAIGTVQVKDGTLKLESADDGISSNSHITIDNGTITITKSDKCVAAIGDITINGGNLTLTPTATKTSSEDGSGHGITVKKSTQTDGTVKRIGNVTVNGGYINVTQSYEGIQGQKITINDGTIIIKALDDAINASDGTSSFGGRPGGMGPNSSSSTASNVGLYFNGGFTMTTSQGDGIDSNGELIIKGGIVLVSQNGQANEPIDAGDGYTPTISGGVVIAVGTQGMASAPKATQTAFFASANGSAGNTLAINDQSGNNIMAWKVPQAYQVITVSAPELETGTYTYCTQATVSGTEYKSGTGFYYPASSATGSGTSIKLTSGSCTSTSQGGFGGPGRP